jgi:hypothetical protein
MKLLINNYTFNPTSKTIAFTDYSQITLNGVLLVVNATVNNKMLYNFVDSTTNATASGNTLTLNASLSTSGMASTDKLIIFYDDPALIPATVDSVNQVQLYNNALYDILDQLTMLANLRHSNASLRAYISGGSSTISQIGNISIYADQFPAAIANQAAIQSNINNVVIS